MLKKEDILKVGKLAQLRLSDAEVVEYGEHVQKILNYFDTLSTINTDGVEPLVTATPMELFLREDAVTQTNTVEEVTSNAPDLRGHLFKVPPVV